MNTNTNTISAISSIYDGVDNKHTREWKAFVESRLINAVDEMFKPVEGRFRITSSCAVGKHFALNTLVPRSQTGRTTIVPRLPPRKTAKRTRAKTASYSSYLRWAFFTEGRKAALTAHELERAAERAPARTDVLRFFF